MDESSIEIEPVSKDTQAECRAWTNFLFTNSLLMRILEARDMENGKTRKKNLFRWMDGWIRRLVGRWMDG